MVRALIVDCLGRTPKGRPATVDVIGAGPRCVAGVLESHGLGVAVRPVESLTRSDVEKADVMLVSAMVSDYKAAVYALQVWRRWNNGPALIGGPITFSSELTQKLLRLGYDAGVVGEAERTLEELCREAGLRRGRLKRWKLASIKGMVLLEHGGLKYTEHREWLSRRELNAYTPSTRAIRGYPLYKASRVYVEIVRGCSNFRRPTLKLPSGKKCIECGKCFQAPLRERLACPVGIPPGCAYCSVPATIGPPRSRDSDKIAAEVKDLIRYGVRRIVLSAPDVLDYGRDLLVEPEPLTDPRSPPANLDALEDLFSKVFSISEVESGEVAVMLENMKPCLVTEEVAKLLSKYFKDTPAHIGLETGDEDLNRKLGRPSTVEECVRAVKILRKYGLRPYVYILRGLPGETPETIARTIEVLEEIKEYVEKVTLYRFRPLPRSALEGAPKPPPAIKDLVALKLVMKIEEINEASKRSLVGSVVRAVIAGTSRKHGVIAYPLKHGPVIFIKKAPEDFRAIVGTLVDVKITSVASARGVEGEIVNLVRESS